MSSRTLLVFGASGTIGQGLIKAALEKGDIKIVGVFRSEESTKKFRARLGDLPADQFVSVIGSFDTEQNAEELQKNVLAKVGGITDVVATVGGFENLSSILQLSVEDLKKIVWTKLELHFLIAKYFLPLIQDKQGTSYTFVNGGSAYHPHPTVGHLTIANGAQMKLAQVLMQELKDKPVRINEFVISCYVGAWDDLTVPPAMAALNVSHTDNIKMGKALLGVTLHGKGESINVKVENLEKLAQSGTL